MYLYLQKIKSSHAKRAFMLRYTEHILLVKSCYEILYCTSNITYPSCTHFRVVKIYIFKSLLKGGKVYLRSFSHINSHIRGRC